MYKVWAGRTYVGSLRYDEYELLTQVDISARISQAFFWIGYGVRALARICTVAVFIFLALLGGMAIIFAYSTPLPVLSPDNVAASIRAVVPLTFTLTGIEFALRMVFMRSLPLSTPYKRYRRDAILSHFHLIDPEEIIVTKEGK